MNKKMLNGVLAVVCFVLLLALPVRNLFFSEIPDTDRGSGAAYASWIMLMFFGALTVIFAARVLRSSPAK